MTLALDQIVESAWKSETRRRPLHPFAKAVLHPAADAELTAAVAY